MKKNSNSMEKTNKELTCIDCIYCIIDKDTNSGYLCEQNGCEIDGPEIDYCDTCFTLIE